MDVKEAKSLDRHFFLHMQDIFEQTKKYRHHQPKILFTHEIIDETFIRQYKPRYCMQEYDSFTI